MSPHINDTVQNRTAAAIGMPPLRTDGCLAEFSNATMRYPCQVLRHPRYRRVRCGGGQAGRAGVHTKRCPFQGCLPRLHAYSSCLGRRLVEQIGVAWSRMAVACFCASIVYSSDGTWISISAVGHAEWTRRVAVVQNLSVACMDAYEDPILKDVVEAGAEAALLALLCFAIASSRSCELFGPSDVRRPARHQVPGTNSSQHYNRIQSTRLNTGCIEF
jgi:hypothetical protein